MRRIANPFYAARHAAARRDQGRPSTPRRHPPELTRGGEAPAATDWTTRPCWYVVAETGERRIWLAGPFRYQDEAEAASSRAALWAVFRSGDEHAGSYQYRVHLHRHGQRSSVLGREMN